MNDVCVCVCVCLCVCQARPAILLLSVDLPLFILWWRRFAELGTKVTPLFMR